MSFSGDLACGLPEYYEGSPLGGRNLLRPPSEGRTEKPTAKIIRLGRAVLARAPAFRSKPANLTFPDRNHTGHPKQVSTSP